MGTSSINKTHKFVIHLKDINKNNPTHNWEVQYQQPKAKREGHFILHIKERKDKMYMEDRPPSPLLSR